VPGAGSTYGLMRLYFSGLFRLLRAARATIPPGPGTRDGARVNAIWSTSLLIKWSVDTPSLNHEVIGNHQS
jgi:hypothetical protein